MDNTPKYISVDTMRAGPELDALAAEMNIGWSKIEDPSHYPSTMIDPQGNHQPVPSYSRDLALAMTLIENWQGMLEITRSPSGTWNVRLLDKQVISMAYAQTLPLAITRAALKSVLPVPEVDWSDDNED